MLLSCKVGSERSQTKMEVSVTERIKKKGDGDREIYVNKDNIIRKIGTERGRRWRQGKSITVRH